jgi:hypothetical protein
LVGGDAGFVGFGAGGDDAGDVDLAAGIAGDGVDGDGDGGVGVDFLGFVGGFDGALEGGGFEAGGADFLDMEEVDGAVVADSVDFGDLGDFFRGDAADGEADAIARGEGDFGVLSEQGVR